jgi:DNA-binding CsgD family transcriptional regulator
MRRRCMRGWVRCSTCVGWTRGCAGWGSAGGGTARRGAPARGWAALTPTELVIARLAAEGRSNPDIAAQMMLSRSTVQTHVSHILAKLGARSRAEIARHAVNT